MEIISRRQLLQAAFVASTVLASSSSGAPEAKPKTIVFVRHGERASPSGDVTLSDKGHARATTLAYVVKDLGIQSIYTSQLIRTVQTAAPAASALKITPEVAPAENTALLIDKLNKLQPGHTALVVHHSNTIPTIVEKLGGGAIPPIREDEFDRMIILTIPSTGAPSVATLRYGGR